MILNKSMMIYKRSCFLPKEIKHSYQKKFSSKCATLSKAHRKFGDIIKNKTEKQANDNVIHETKRDYNFPKRIFFGKLHLLARNYHKGKIMYI